MNFSGVLITSLKTATNNYAVLIISAVYAFLYYVANSVGYGIMFSSAVGITGIFYFLAWWKLEHRAVASHKMKRKIVFSIQDGNYRRAILSREFKKMAALKVIMLKLLSMLIFSVIFICKAPEGIVKELMLLMVIYFLAMTFSGNIYFNSAKTELYEKMEDILLLSGISRKKNLRLALGFVLVCGNIMGVCYFAICKSFALLRGVSFSAFLYFMYYFIALVIGGMIAYIFTFKYLKSLKDERLMRRYIYGVTFLIYMMFCLAVM